MLSRVSGGCVAAIAMSHADTDEQPDARRGGGGAGEHAEGEAPGAGPAQREHPQQRVAPARRGRPPGRPPSDRPAAAPPAAVVLARVTAVAPESWPPTAARLEAHGLVRQVRPARVVGDDDPRRPVQQPGDARPHGGGVVRVEVRGRLVEQHQRGAVSRRRKARASAIRWRWPADSRVPRSPSRVARPSGSAATTSAASASATARAHGLVVGAGHPEPDVVGHGRVEQVRALRQPRDPPAPLVDGQVAQVHPVHRDPSLVGVGEPQQHRQQRRLPGAAGPGQQQGPPRRHGEVDAVQRRDHPRRDGSGARPSNRSSGGPSGTASAAARGRRAPGPAGPARRRPARPPPRPPCSRGTGPPPRAAAGRPPARGSAPAARSPGRAARRAAGSRSGRRPAPPTASRAAPAPARTGTRSAATASVASRCASRRPPDQRDLGLGPPEDRQRRQALDGVEEVPAEPAEQPPLLARVVLGLPADQRHEHRDQRQGQRDDQRGEPVGVQRPRPARRPARARPARAAAGTGRRSRRARRGRGWPAWPARRGRASRGRPPAR